VTTFLLIRHALCDPVGKSIAGRAPGVGLNEIGRGQAIALAQRLSDLPVAAIYSSPLERAVETAEPLAHVLGLRVVRESGLNEVDFGEWTGRTLSELEGMPGWSEFNVRRSTARIPGGESMGEVVARSMEALEQIRRTHKPGASLVGVVSHGDVLRGIIANFLGIDLDAIHRIDIAPASVSILSFHEGNPQLLLLNSTDGWPPQVVSATR
jgi:probable phosphomutase (TIGR03848 family)